MTKRQIAEELGLSAKMRGRWCKAHEGNGAKAFPGQGKARDEELVALRRELPRVKKERDFFREAAVFFASERKRSTG